MELAELGGAAGASWLEFAGTKGLATGSYRSEQLSRKLSACCGHWVELVAMMMGSDEVMGSGGDRRAQS
jgi:hypothetical protein